MFADILSPAQQSVLERLGALQDVRAFYLAGGTALALQLGHRRSIDLDFFREQGFDPTDLVRRLRLGTTTMVRRSEGDTLTVDIDGVTTSFFAYPYPLLRSLRSSPWSLSVAAVEDIAAMKLSALAGRGARKDFVDLYFICREIMSLRELVRCFEEKFKGVPYERYHVLKSLTYFDDAETEIMPDLTRPASWEEIKRFFRSEAPRLLVDD